MRCTLTQQRKAGVTIGVCAQRLHQLPAWQPLPSSQKEEAMEMMDWVVLIGGIFAIGWVNWYFFFAERSIASAAAGNGGTQEITVTVKGGYVPAVIRVQRGTPVRVIFDRQETSSCSEEVVLPEFGIKRFLPAFQKTSVEFTPRATGTYDFMCGMSMLHGKIIVEE